MRRAPVLVVVFILSALVRCGGDSGSGPDPSKPSALSLVSGNNQTGTVGQALGQLLVVRVLNFQGQAVQGATVNWVVTAGGGQLSSAATVTNAQGDASVAWTLGTAAGSSNNTVHVTVNGLNGIAATFSASANAGVATQLVAISGDAQSATVGDALAQPLVVAARDQYGNGVGGQAVDWAITQGAGQLSATSTTTNAQGQAAVSWTVGTGAGSNNQRVTATVTGLTGSPVLFRASATAGAVAQLAISSGNNQSAEVNHPLPQSIAVFAADQYDNPVGGATITWSVTSAGGGALAPSAAQTSAAGLVSATWTLGTTAGGQTARARFGTSGPSVTFDATADPGPAFAIAAAAGDNQTDTVTKTIADPLVVHVTDAFGNAVAGVAVTWAVSTGGGAIVPNGAGTNSSGNNSAVFTLGTVAGTGAQRVTASAGTLAGSPVEFRANGLPKRAVTLAAFTGEDQSGYVGAALANPIVVRALDEYGNAVPGVAVTWAVTLGAGTFPDSSIATDAGGTSAVVWTLGTTPGANGAEASAGGLTGSPIAFHATGVAGPPATIVRISGDAQTDTVGATLPLALVVEIRDRFDNLVPAQAVDWAASGGGSVSIARSSTDGTGRASTVRVLGTVAGTDNNATTAIPPGFASVQTTFHASVQPGAPVGIVKAAGDAQTGLAAVVLPDALRVRITDTHGNGVAGVTLAWQAGAGSGTISAVDVTSTTDGSASGLWTLGAHAGVQSGTATATGIAAAPNVTFAATATPNATIAGNVTTSNALLAPPALSAKRNGSPLPAAAMPAAAKQRATAGLVVTPTAAPTRRPSARTVVPDELIVTFRADRLNTPPRGSLALAAPANAAAAGLAIHRSLAEREQRGELQTRGVSPLLLAARVRVDPARIDEIAQQLRGDARIAAVERNGLVWRDDIEAARAIVSADPLYGYQAWHYAMIDVPQAWDITRGSASVIVAVVDDGTRFDHPDLTANLTTDGYDFVSELPIDICGGGTTSNAGDGTGYDSDPTIPVSYTLDPAGCVPGPDQYGGHGVHVAGTIGAAGNNGQGGAGINWTVRIRPVRVIGSAGVGTDYDIAQGVLYAAGLPADNGSGGTVKPATAARIINMSLGGPVPTTVEHDAIIAATNAGSLIIAAAGNHATSDPFYPAAFPEVLSVTAVGPDAQLASYSAFGPTVDISAPGGDFADGDVSFGVISGFWDFFDAAPVYFSLVGTSMATPHVSGAAALLLAQNPALTAMQLRDLLTTYAVDVGTAGRDDEYGAGVVNARNSLTQSFDYPRALFARLYDAATGAIVATNPTAGGGAFQFTQLSDRAYYVYAGQDQAGDGAIGVAGRRWGALGAAAAPTAVTVDGAAVYPASFTIGYPGEQEPNDAPGIADALALGGYLFGIISDPVVDADYSIVRISQAATYTFETFAAAGACGYALEEDTILELWTFDGTQLAVNDDIDVPRGNYCSRLVLPLTPGTYFVRIRGFYGGRYQVRVRGP